MEEEEEAGSTLKVATCQGVFRVVWPRFSAEAGGIKLGFVCVPQKFNTIGTLDSAAQKAVGAETCSIFVAFIGDRRVCKSLGWRTGNLTRFGKCMGVVMQHAFVRPRRG